MISLISAQSYHTGRQAYPTQQYSTAGGKQYPAQQYPTQQYSNPAAGGMVAATAPVAPPPYPGPNKPTLPPIKAHPMDKDGIPLPAIYVEP